MFSYWSLAKKLGRIKAVYADDDAKALQNIKCLAQKYAETLLGDEFPISGFLGWSFGGLIAYECARIFAKIGIIVPVIMLDSHIHSKDQIYKDGSDAEMLFDALGLKSENALHLTLEEAIKAGGSSLKDYVKSDGSTGYFQHNFLVYGRAGKNCVKCSSVIEKIKIAGRSSFFCPNCQKLDIV